MNVQTAPLQYTSALLDKILGNEVLHAPAAGAFDLCEIGLLKAPPTFAPGMVRADVTEADYPGYARQPLVYGSVSHDVSGRSQVQCGSLLFSPSGSATPNTIYAAAIFDAHAAGNLLAIAVFSSPLELRDTPDDLTVVPVVSLPDRAAANAGVVAVVS